MAYTAEKRAETLRLYQEHGTSQTVKLTGVPARTLLTWAKTAGVTAQAGAEKTRAAQAVAAERTATVWADFRQQEALHAGAAANQMRRATLQASEDGDAGLLRARVIAYGIFVDKAELLSGQATERIEVWAQSELDRDLHSLIDEMEGRIRDGR